MLWGLYVVDIGRFLKAPALSIAATVIKATAWIGMRFFPPRLQGLGDVSSVLSFELRAFAFRVCGTKCFLVALSTTT